MTVRDQTRASTQAPLAFRVARISTLVALSVVGSFIHLPSPIGTVAFDSWPGFFAALYFGPFDGAIVTGLGHVATSIVNGFPLGILHLPIALGLAFAGWAIGAVNRIRRVWSPIAALAIGIAINTGLAVVAIPVIGLPATVAFIPFLFVAACVNASLAGFTYYALRRKLPF